MKFKKIGILGGMGPEASACFYSKLIVLSQEKYCAVQDTDYPPILLYSLPLEGFNESGIVNKAIVLSQLIHGVKTLENAGCDFIVIPCNTVHYFIDELKKKTPIPILSIVEETAKKIKIAKINKVGLLASETTLKLELYEHILKQNSIDCITPEIKDFSKITSLILEIMGGAISLETKAEVLNLIENMKKKPVEAIVLGCTELPSAIKQQDVNLKIFDTLQILAEATLEYSGS